MDFKAFFFAMSVPERDAYAERAGTSRGLLTQLAYGNKQIELGFADVLVALSEGRITLDGLPLTENAKRQRAIREQVSSVQDQEPRPDISKSVLFAPTADGDRRTRLLADAPFRRLKEHAE